MWESLRIGLVLGSEDVKEAYRRTLVGPLWITLGLGVQVAAIGVVFSLVFGVDIKEYLPFLAVSLVLWNVIQVTMIESCQAFINAQKLIKQIHLPLVSFSLRVVWKNAVVFGHNFLVIPVVFLLFWQVPHWTMLLALPGLVLVALNLSWVGLVLGFASARYRDVAQIVQSLLTVVFYVTPVLWLPSAVPDHFRDVVLGLNPFYHLMEVVRAPLLGQIPSLSSWLVSSVLACMGLLFARYVLFRWGSRLAYWV